MHISIHKKIRVGFFIAFTAIIGASVVSYLIAKNLQHNASRLQHAVEVSKRLELISRHLKDAEGAIRGYSITHQQEYLHPSMEERSVKIESEYRKLRRVIDDPPQQKNLDTLKQLLDIKYGQLLAAARNEGGQPTSEGELSMEQIDRKMQDMIAIEEAQLSEKSRLFTFFSNLWIPIVFIISLIAIIIGIYSYITLNREFRLQLHIESRMRSYQRELQENINLLNKSNQELEQFAYVASHDLQEPLRKISTFSDRLVLKYRDEIPPEAGQLVDRMVSAVGRMRVLINDLLIFSRAGRITPDTIAQIDLNELLADVLGDLEAPLQEINGSVVTDQLPPIEGSDTGLHQLFQNILSNSIKFASPDRPLQIRITGEVLTGYEAGVSGEKKAAGKYLRIRVEDNGIGFEQGYADRIFLIFQRLHGVSEYKGTGIGLAICKKIAEAHQGFISAEGQPGAGATFIITLPLKQLRED